MNKKCVIYMRKACESQASTGSMFKKQERALQSLIIKKGLKKAKTLREIGSGVSVAKRPIFNQLLNDIYAGEIQKVICSDLSRLTRDVNVWAILEELIRKGKLEIITPYSYYCKANCGKWGWSYPI